MPRLNLPSCCSGPVSTHTLAKQAWHSEVTTETYRDSTLGDGKHQVEREPNTSNQAAYQFHRGCCPVALQPCSHGCHSARTAKVAKKDQSIQGAGATLQMAGFIGSAINLIQRPSSFSDYLESWGFGIRHHQPPDKLSLGCRCASTADAGLIRA